MKLNIANPVTGAQKVIEVDDEKKLACLYDKRTSQQIEGQNLGEEYEGYIFRISGGNDKQGFPMKQGVLVNRRVRLLLKKGVSCFRERKRGQRKRKSVRGCIVGSDIAVLNLVIVKKGEKEIEGITDVMVDKRLGPKRANNIRKLFNLSKDDDVRKYVVRRTFTTKKGKTVSKAPKIQRLITPRRIQRKRKAAEAIEKKREVQKIQKAEYEQVLKKRQNERSEKKAAEASKRKSRMSKREPRKD